MEVTVTVGGVILTAPRISWAMGRGACLLGSISIPFIDVGTLCCGQGALGCIQWLKEGKH